MRLLALSLFIPVVACAAPSRGVDAVAPVPATAALRPGATMAQPADDPSRMLSPGECETLRAWIQETCETPSTHSAVTRGWCADVMARTSSSAWVRDCSASVPSGELACFLRAPDATAMMTCDGEIDG